jgi:hypothetical protein
MLLSPTEVMEEGLDIMNVRLGRKSEEEKALEFHKHYGSSPLDVAEIWFDLCSHGNLTMKEKNMRGFKRLLLALFWLWAYPKNASLVASRFGVCKDYAGGKHLWKWIDLIAGLKWKKIFWDASLDDPNTEIFTISVDGTDFNLWEVQHPNFPIDQKACSFKFKHCAAKYIIALSVFRSKCVFIAGPFKGGVGDLKMMRDSGLMEKLFAGDKIAIVDRGFRSTIAQERKHLSYPDNMDEKNLNNFKSRARLRQETYNRRLKNFEALSNTFRHGFNKHGAVLTAVAVIVQYHMDNGSPLYSV